MVIQHSPLKDDENEPETEIEMIDGRKSIANKKNNEKNHKEKHDVNNIPIDVLDTILKENESKEKEGQSEENTEVQVNDEMNNDEIEDGDEHVETCSDYGEKESVDLEEITDVLHQQEDEIEEKEETITQLQK